MPLSKKLSPKHSKAALMLALDKPRQEVADEAGWTLSWLNQLMMDPMFLAEIDRMVETYIDKTMAEVVKATDLLITEAPLAAQRLIDASKDNTNKTAQLRANLAILEKAGVKTPEKPRGVRTEFVLQIGDPRTVRDAEIEEDEDEEQHLVGDGDAQTA